MGNVSVKDRSERDLSTSVCSCEYVSGDVLLPCRECPGEGSLSNARCRAGCLRALGPGTSSIVLAEYNEVRYSGDAVHALQHVSRVLEELDSFCVERHDMRALSGLRCEKCVYNPRRLYPGIRRALFLDIGECYARIRGPLLDRAPSVEECGECSRGVRDRLLLLLYMFEELRKVVLREGFGVVLDEEEVCSDRPVPIKSLPNEKDLLASTSNVEVSRLQEALEKTLEVHRDIRPCFSNAWIKPALPRTGELVQGKRMNGSRIRLFHIPGREESFYHILPEEYSFNRREVKMIQDVRERLLLEDMSMVRLEDHESVRSFVEKVSSKSFTTLLQQRNGMSRLEAAARGKTMAEVLARYTAGMGVLEYILWDDDVQDVYVDAPSSANPLHLTAGVSHPKLVGKLVSNVVLDSGEMDTIVSRLRHISGQAFSEAKPVLETDMEGYNTRATAIGPPLSPHGVALAFRRHSSEPWTLPLLVSKGSLCPLAAGLLWYLVDGRAAMIIAGSRGAGKSSLLGSLLFALPRSQRMLIIEDTMELPIHHLQKLGYKAQGLQIGGGLEGRDALRVSLRLGEGALILGEVRGEEARLLYEAMRTGTAGSTVMGTFHADSPRAVYERVVHDLGIPFQSFSATDIVLIAGLVRPGGGSMVRRRLTHIAEVNKNTEGAFRILMEYDEEEDVLKATDDFYYRSEVISSIAHSWGMGVEEAINEIETRGRVVQDVVGMGDVHCGASPTSRAFSLFKDVRRLDGDVFQLWKDAFMEGE